MSLTATYRLQLKPGFGFREVAELAEYLTDLGISHVYASPYLKAASGSQHGYDVVDHSHVNDELGGPAAFEQMCSTLKQVGLGQLVDVVPNHMAIRGRENKWWWDVLENGQSSKYAPYFDVDWEPPETRLRNLILLPVLGSQYGKAVESGEIKFRRFGVFFRVCYYDHEFPVAPRSLAPLLRDTAQRSGSDQLALIADILTALPLPSSTEPAAIARRHRDRRVIGLWLEKLFSEDPELAAKLDAVIADINSNPVALHAILENQNYRLAHWRAAGRDLGYRRFFDINSLVGIRMENRDAFQETHALLLGLLAERVIDGLRIDHIDGLRDPEEYLDRLRQAAPQTWLLVEKILEPGEHLPPSWPVDGTTGYDFLCSLGGLFVDSSSASRFTQIYRDFTGCERDYAAIVREKKDQIMSSVLGSDLNRLTAMLLEVCESRPQFRDFSRHDLHEALKAITIELPVYRTYVRRNGLPFKQDQDYIACATSAARQARPDLDPELFDVIENILLLRLTGDLECELSLRFQQFSGPVMAKAVEDTTFYCFNRFIALNEVGGDPSTFGTPVKEFYRRCHETQLNYPETLSTTTTHDTKRSEDVRARLALLSEIPDRWAQAAHQWAQHNKRHWGTEPPDRNVEYFVYQTLIGTWPIAEERLSAYVQKAIREAKEHTSWTNPSEKYEAAILNFVSEILADTGFVEELSKFVGPLVQPGQVNALAQTLIKLMAPGVPDFYQGSELWHFVLVDPDNRRTVDYSTRRGLLARMRQSTVDEVWRNRDEGMSKLWTIWKGLSVRRRYSTAFGRDGSFTPLFARGTGCEHVVAFCRGESVVTIVPRLLLKLGGNWRDTRLTIPRGVWHNELDGQSLAGGEIELASIFSKFPVALLVRENNQ